MKYIDNIPTKSLPEGWGVVHNRAIPADPIGLFGFRAWREKINLYEREVCPCAWAPQLATHYKVRGMGHWEGAVRTSADVAP